MKRRGREAFAEERSEEALSTGIDKLGGRVNNELGKPTRVSEGSGRTIVRRGLRPPEWPLSELSSGSSDVVRRRWFAVRQHLSEL